MSYGGRPEDLANAGYITDWEGEQMAERESDTHDESQNTSDWSARKVIEVGLRIAERYRAQDMFQTIALTPAQGREVLAALAVPSIAEQFPVAWQLVEGEDLRWQEKRPTEPGDWMPLYAAPLSHALPTCEGSKAYNVAEMAGKPLYVPVCDAHADAWFTERNHLRGGMDANCIACACEPPSAIAAPRWFVRAGGDSYDTWLPTDRAGLRKAFCEALYGSEDCADDKDIDGYLTEFDRRVLEDKDVRWSFEDGWLEVYVLANVDGRAKVGGADDSHADK